MVNILTDSEADVRFDKEKRDDSVARKEGEPDAIFNYSGSVMKAELANARNRVSHLKAPGVLGHVVKPGSMSFYEMNGKTFAVSEGRWWLIKVSTCLRCFNISLKKDHFNLDVYTELIYRDQSGRTG